MPGFVSKKNQLVKVYLVRPKVARLLNVSPVTMLRHFAPALAPFYKYQEGKSLCQTNKCCNKESVLVSHIGNPRSYAGQSC